MNLKSFLLSLLLVFVSFKNFSQNANKFTNKLSSKKMKTATLANGCFWCTEAIFQRIKGVESVLSGYTGGTVENPTYEQVCSGYTGHAEALQVVFNPEIISYRELLEIFFSTHDPTTLNRQGYDVGTQYRSAIFYHNEKQRKEAIKLVNDLTKAKVFDKKIVTQIVPFTKFYEAEKYHQNYYNNNRNQGYCRAVINPKLEKFIKNYKDKLK